MGDLYKEESLTDQSCTVLFPSKGQQPANDMCRSLLGTTPGGTPIYGLYRICHPIGYGFLTEQSETRYTFAPVTVIDKSMIIQAAVLCF